MTPPAPLAPLFWKDYKTLVATLTPSARRFSARRDDGSHIPLFRGHRDRNWPLASTLERYLGKETSLKAYRQGCHSAWSTLKSHRFTDMIFDPACDTRYSAVRRQMPDIEFLAFLRHHGFPSPLLDWTESPYIAAFFALEEPPPENQHPCVVIYRPRITATPATKPHIVLLGPFLGTAQRHVTQQCWYTAAIRKGPGGETLLCSQLEVFSKPAGVDSQGSLDKLVIHRDEREKALAELAYMNITAFSLYGGADALIKTIAPRVF